MITKKKEKGDKTLKVQPFFPFLGFSFYIKNAECMKRQVVDGIPSSGLQEKKCVARPRAWKKRDGLDGSRHAWGQKTEKELMQMV